MAPTRFRDVVVTGLLRELAEETGAVISGDNSHTYLVGYGRVLQRGGKPEFCALTLLRQDSTELFIRKREKRYVDEILFRPLASLRLSDIKAGLAAFVADLEQQENVGYALMFSAICARQFMDRFTDEQEIEAWMLDKPTTRY